MQNDIESRPATLPNTEPKSLASEMSIRASTNPHKVEYPTWKKVLIVFVISWMALVMAFSSTAIFTATTEIADEFSTTVGVLNAANAGVLLLMGMASFLWVPFSKVGIT